MVNGLIQLTNNSYPSTVNGYYLLVNCSLSIVNGLINQQPSLVPTLYQGIVMCLVFISCWTRFSCKSIRIPSGKHAKNYGKSPCLMGKLTISMAMFNSFLYVYHSYSAGWKPFGIKWWLSVHSHPHGYITMVSPSFLQTIRNPRKSTNKSVVYQWWIIPITTSD